MGHYEEYTPRQAEIVKDLLQLGQARPNYDREMARRLRASADEQLAPISERLAEGSKPRIVVTKHRLSQVHHCEGHMKAEDSRDFQWTLMNVRGRVVHRAMEGLIMSRYTRTPLELAETSVVVVASAAAPAAARAA
jgi:hypothetical protein